jgi:GNAT superfamily N-acetyltransferase
MPVDGLEVPVLLNLIAVGVGALGAGQEDDVHVVGMFVLDSLSLGLFAAVAATRRCWPGSRSCPPWALAVLAMLALLVYLMILDKPLWIQVTAMSAFSMLPAVAQDSGALVAAQRLAYNLLGLGLPLLVLLVLALLRERHPTTAPAPAPAPACRVSGVPVVRRATADDLPALLPLVAAFCAVDGHPYDEAVVARGPPAVAGGRRAGQVLVLEQHAGLAGYAVLTWSWSLESGGRDCILDELYVAQRDSGRGAHLLAAAMEHAADHGARACFLETEAANTRVRRFYARHGFAPEDSVWMRRELPAVSGRSAGSR